MNNKKSKRRLNRKVNWFESGGSTSNTGSANPFSNVLSSLSDALGTGNNTGYNPNADIEGYIYGNPQEGVLENFISNVSGKSVENALNILRQDRLDTSNISSNEDILSNWDALQFRYTYEKTPNLVGKTLLSTALGAPWLDFDEKGKAKYDFGHTAATVEGASYGSAFGPWGALAGGILGGVLDLGSRLGRNKRIEKINAGIEKSNNQKISAMYDATKNIASQNKLLAQANYSAFGGPINFNNILSDGGTLNEFSNGITLINNGGTHENNPYGGVFIGVDNEGTPNLVEEGEVIFDDYVFSNRIKAKKSDLIEFNLPDKYEGYTLAEVATEIQKESKERPNDAISKEGLSNMMNRLMGLSEKVRNNRNKNNELNILSEGGSKENNGLKPLWEKVKEAVQEAEKKRKAAELLKNINKQTPKVPKPKPLAPLERSKNTTTPKDNKNENTKKEPWWGFASRTIKEQQQKQADSIVKRSYENSLPIKPKIKKLEPVQSNIGTQAKVESKEKEIALPKGYSRTKDGLILKEKPSLKPSTPTTKSGGLAGNGNTTGATKSVNNKDEEKTNKVTTKASADTKSEAEGSYPIGETGASRLRYAPIVASGLAVLNDILGGNKPDYSLFNNYEKALRRTSYPAYRPLGNYMSFKPFDTEFYINKLSQNAAATRSAIENNSGGNRATAMAGLLAADANLTKGFGEVARQGSEYNRGLQERTNAFNADINKINANLSLDASKHAQNAMLNQAKMLGDLATRKQMVLENTKAAQSANLTNFLQGLADAGTEAYDRETLKWLKESGVLACGGKLKRKKKVK